MSEFFESVPILLAAVIGGYLLGAIPLADWIGRRHGVDVFSIGSGLAGSSNILRCVGLVPAVLVFIGDVGKGTLAIVVADLLGVESPWSLLPAGAAVVGHWNSVFTRFRGGDGLATLGGVILGLFPVFGILSASIALLVALGGQRMPYTSLMSVVFGYTTLVGLNMAYGGDIPLVLGLGGFSGLVMAHALLGHHRRRHDTEWDDGLDSERATDPTTSR